MNKKFIQARKSVSELIFKVLSRNMSVKDALKQFPSDSDDPSVHCMWHALIHYEADEDYRAQDRDYAEEQDDYLEMIGYILREGEPIPQNIIMEYQNKYDIALVPRSKGIINWCKNLLRSTI